VKDVRRLLVFASAVVFADTVFYAAITPLLPELVREFGLSKGDAGRLSAAYPAGTLVAALPAGWLAARAGVRVVTLSALALLGASSVAFAFADSIWALDLARFMQGVAGAGTWAGAFAWLLGAAPRERRGELIGAVLGFGIAGALFGPAIGGLAGEIGRADVFSGVAVVAGGLAVWALRVPASEPPGPPSARDLGRAVRDHTVLAGMWLTVVLGLLFGVLSVLAPLHFAAIGAGAGVIALAFIVSAGLEAIASPLIGRASDRHGRRLPVLAGLGLSAVGAMLLPLPQTAWLLVVTVCVCGVFFGSLWAPSMALLSDGMEARGVPQAFAMALSNVAWALGQASGAGAGAALADTAGDTATYLALACLCAGTLAVMVRRLEPPGASDRAPS
jgi:MFS family permease